MYFNKYFIQIKLKDNYSIILSYFDADSDEVFKLSVSVKPRTFKSILC